MRTIIAGSRTITQYTILLKALEKLPWKITTVISGGAKGVDELGEAYAYLHKIPLEIYNAEWNIYGKAAGPIRNALMAGKADALVALWDGSSRGTAHMIETARKKGLRVEVVLV